ncbi:MAG: peroxidase [Dehalococcoidia bacterium]|nr:peroxidase [Dehalococcoidia bacterium]|tara:strand:- start:1192 stop:1437 length:246 start_codon:yes stop_codon:yes gene_type:complete
MPYVKTIPYEDAQGDLKETYDRMIKSRGFISNVQAVSSLKPNIMQTLVAHSASVMFGESGVSRAEREMVASVVSATNKCQY